MTTPRRTNAASSDPRPRLLRLAMPGAAAVLVTASVVGVAVAQSAHRPPTEPSASAPVDAAAAAAPKKANLPAAGDDSPYRARRLQSFSRSAERVTIKKKPHVTDHEFRTAPLNLWPTPREKGKPLSVLPEGGKVATTGVKKAGSRRSSTPARSGGSTTPTSPRRSRPPPRRAPLRAPPRVPRPAPPA